MSRLWHYIVMVLGSLGLGAWFSVFVKIKKEVEELNNSLQNEKRGRKIERKIQKDFQKVSLNDLLRKFSK